MWENLTEAQGLIVSGVVSGFLTIAAAILGVGVGSRLFGGRISDLSSLLDASNRHLDTHSSSVAQKVSELIEKTAELGNISEVIESTRSRLELIKDDINQQLSSTMSGIAELKSRMSEVQDAQFNASNPVSFDSSDLRGTIREDWNIIRGIIEKIASNPIIDGRTRARYNRIDRRQYWYLLEELNKDKRLDGRYNDFIKSVEIWQRFRSNRAEPMPEDAEQMKTLRNSIESAFGEGL